MPELTRTENNFIFLLRAALADRVVEAREVSCGDGDCAVGVRQGTCKGGDCAVGVRQGTCEGGDRAVDAGESAPGFDAQGVLRLAYEHKLWHMILSAMPQELLPENVNRRAELIGRVAAQVTASSAFLALLQDMESAGFHPLVVKGIICRSLYPHPELRPSADEDLYVCADEFEDCCAFLQSRGLVPDKTPFSLYGEVGFRGNGGLYIELHRDLFEGEALSSLSELFDLKALTPERYDSGYGGTVASMDPHLHFLYLLLHAYKHFVHSGFGIRQVCDIGFWANAYSARIDWQQLSLQCDALHIKGFTVALLGITRHYLGMSLSLSPTWDCTREYCLPMLKDLLCGGIYGSSDADRLHAGTMTLNAVSASGDRKVSSLLRTLFPSRALLHGSYPFLDRHPFLLPVAWLLRLASYGKRSIRGKTNAAKSLSIGKERLALLRFYGILN